MSNSQNKAAQPVAPLRNCDGTLNLTHYRNKAQTERASAIHQFGKIIQSLIGLQHQSK